MESTDPVTADVEQGIQRLVKATMAKRPALESLVKPFAELFIEKSRVARTLKKEADRDASDLSASRRLSDGVPLLAGVALDSLAPALDHAFGALVPVLNRLFPAFTADLERINSAHHDASLNLVALAGACLESSFTGSSKSINASETPIDPSGLGFVVNLVLSAVLQSLAPSLAQRIKDGNWQRGYCPICGSLPSLSYLSKPAAENAGFLVGGGGRRYLHCAVCGHNWRVSRTLCAACERELTDQKMYLRVQDDAGERVDVCHHCHHYLPCIDLRETGVFPHLDTAAVGLAHLDMLAQDKGYAPMFRTPWNTFKPPAPVQPAQ
ncbi:MAG: formate dehydrogenase accessory protein FdhE [Desulfobacterales bacterium]